MSLLRGAAFNLYLLALTLTMGLGAFPIRLLRKQELALDYAKLWARCVLWGLRHIGSIRIEIRGSENLPQGPCLIASQHQSFFDGFIWMNTVPRPAYIIKKELTRIPLVGPMLLLSGMIPVDREGGSQALRDLMDATATAQREGRQVILFPQGTRTDPGVKAPIQNGIVAVARQIKGPVIPVVTNSGFFWPRSPWRKYSGTLIIAIGRPLPPTRGRELISTLDEAWEVLCKTHQIPHHPVDNSVDIDRKNGASSS
ncbi:lysophospholipid acyltransferase family protein [Acetobacteraceae bacterium ESL0709]|nr:lysophospholipid acyltransferase family protein [Acetobacteraceae bacterium ESL0697]MDF7678565.1 lysophospholipid acyltransferase family protein [Acetobacteraceae bacterium ESL0709]